MDLVDMLNAVLEDYSDVRISQITGIERTRLNRIKNGKFKITIEELRKIVNSFMLSEEKAKARFGDRSADPLFSFLPYDINLPFVREDIGKVDFVLHLASNTHPMQYSTDPIGTITTNIMRFTGRTGATLNFSMRNIADI